MAPRIKTRDRIIEASLELFNEQGERNVTTNHIAAHLGISPGNLYYHFRNKLEIISELFERYAAQVEGFLQRPTGRGMTMDDKAFYLEALLQGMWQYRFIHRDLEQILEGDSVLAARYRQFARTALSNAQQIYQGFADAGILRITPAIAETLAINGLIMLTAWVRFIATVSEPGQAITPAMLRRGVLQLVQLESPWVSDAYRAELDQLLARLAVPFTMIVPEGSEQLESV